jgi:histidinol-phosphate aminotransferase
LFVEPGVTVATSLGAYPTFNFHVHGYGDGWSRPLRRRPRGSESLLIWPSENARLIFFANPDNPMGSWWDGAAVRA